MVAGRRSERLHLVRFTSLLRMAQEKLVRRGVDKLVHDKLAHVTSPNMPHAVCQVASHAPRGWLDLAPSWACCAG